MVICIQKGINYFHKVSGRHCPSNISCFIKIHIFAFLMPAYSGCRPVQETIKWVFCFVHFFQHQQRTQTIHIDVGMPTSNCNSYTSVQWTISADKYELVGSSSGPPPSLVSKENALGLVFNDSYPSCHPTITAETLIGMPSIKGNQWPHCYFQQPPDSRRKRHYSVYANLSDASINQ